jgi:hypothetical protein
VRGPVIISRFSSNLERYEGRREVGIEGRRAEWICRRFWWKEEREDGEAVEPDGSGEESGGREREENEEGMLELRYRELIGRGVLMQGEKMSSIIQMARFTTEQE